MKKILIAIALFAATSAAFAQTKTTGSYSAAEASRQMYSDLQLNEGQYLQIKALNSIKEERLRDIEQIYRNDPQMMQEKTTALHAEMDAEYKQVLRPSQYDMYIKSEGRSTAATTPMPADSGMENDMQDTNTGMDQQTPVQGNTDAKVKTNDMKAKTENGESKVKTSDVKVKDEKDKFKAQDSRTNSKVKVQGDKLKVEDKNSKMKVEDDKVKIKSRD